MDFEQMKTEFIKRIDNKELINATISQPRQKSNEIKRVKIKPIELKGKYHIQIEYQFERVLKHENVLLEKFSEAFELLLQQFRQIHAQFIDENIQIQLSKKIKYFGKKKNQNHLSKSTYLIIAKSNIY